jgi:hypothetical protein
MQQKILSSDPGARHQHARPRAYTVVASCQDAVSRPLHGQQKLRRACARARSDAVWVYCAFVSLFPCECRHVYGFNIHTCIQAHIYTHTHSNTQTYPKAYICTYMYIHICLHTYISFLPGRPRGTRPPALGFEAAAISCRQPFQHVSMYVLSVYVCVCVYIYAFCECVFVLVRKYVRACCMYIYLHNA